MVLARFKSLNRCRLGALPKCALDKTMVQQMSRYLVDMFGDGIRSLRFSQASFYPFDPLVRKVLNSKYIRPKADPVLVR